MSPAPEVAPSRRFLYDWPLLMAVNIIIVLLAGTQVRSSLTELDGYRKASADLGVERFRANKEYQQIEATFAGLISLAATDADARRIVDKFQIAVRGEIEVPALGSEPIKNVLP